MCKVLYIYFNEINSPGVQKKVRSKIVALNELGLDTTGIFLGGKLEERYFDKVEKVDYVPLDKIQLPSIWNRRYFRNYNWLVHKNKNDKKRYEKLDEIVSSYQFDIILMRYPGANKYLIDFLKKYKGSVVFEHNTKELIELEINEIPGKLKAKKLCDEKKYGPEALRLVAGITGVGNEVLGYEEKRAGTQISCQLVPNGIDVSKIPVRSAPMFDGKLLNILFVTGSPSPWVGVDLLLSSLATYAGDVEVKIFIVGPINQKLVNQCAGLNISHLVEFTGLKSKEELNEYFNSCHIAIGSLGMFRLTFNEHSTLKACEYASRGIPFITSYNDTNFYQLEEFSPFYKVIQVMDDKLNFDFLIDFAKNSLADLEHPQKMHLLSERSIDFKVQMKKLASFLQNLISDKQ